MSSQRPGSGHSERRHRDRRQGDRRKGSPVLVLALDGATFDVLDPLCDAGKLPNLAAWRRDADSRPLRSTTPPMSFPAWSTFMTGLEPGQHGLFDFTQKLPSQYRIRFTNATDRRGASLFRRVSEAGGSSLVLGLPATFPPEAGSGLLVAGFDAPVSTGTDPSSASDPALYTRVAQRVGPWMRPDIDEGARDRDWHERTPARLLARVDRKRDFALEALAELRRCGRSPEFAMVVFSESDTVAHHFWRDHDPASPRHDAAVSSARRNAVSDVYQRLDAACGEIRAAFGEDAHCVVVSDHGSGGASRHVVYLNGRLAECGLLKRTPRERTAWDALARGARDTGLKFLPPAVAQALFRRARGAAARLESAARFGGHDWSRTLAFSEEANTQPGVWINLRGRERDGCVEPSDYERVRGEVIAALLEWKLPDGGAVVEAARRREEVYAGPHTERAPDIVVELASDDGYGLSIVATPWASAAPPHGSSVRWLEDDELAGGRGMGLNGTHRRNGIWIATGEASAWLDPDSQPHLSQVAPAVLGGMGIAWKGSPGDATPRSYSAEEEELVAARLRALGYLE